MSWELRERSCNVIVMGAAGKVSFNENTPQNIHLQLETFRPEKDASVPSSLNSPSSGIGLFYADSGFFDGKNRVLWRIGSKPFL